MEKRLMKKQVNEAHSLLELLKQKEEVIGATGGDFQIRAVLVRLLYSKKSSGLQQAIEACEEVGNRTLKCYYFDQFPELKERLNIFCKEMLALGETKNK